MADDDSSELSSLSSLSPAPSDDESDIQLKPEKGILKFFHKVPKGSTAPAREPSPPPRKRSPSPPHEFVLADNQDIAFIVMFRNRFGEALPKSLANFGPQELERDIVDAVPGERVEHFVCAMLKLLLNRQQDVKPGHYNRALEEAVQSNKSQWLSEWVESPLAGGKSFATMTPVERLSLLRALVLWTMATARSVRDILDHAYKGKRQEDDSNIAFSVQPWGCDSDKRRYFLIEGRDDTAFRVYRESNPAGFTRTWWSVAGSIDELKALTSRLEMHDGGPKAKKLARKLNDEIPRFEATEEKRKRREYRQMRKEQFKRPEPGFSMYEGRTRGKRMKYTYSDDEMDFYSDSTGAPTRRSMRNTGTSTPAEPSGPVVTASGRHIRAPNRLNAETLSNGGASRAPSVAGDASDRQDVEMEETSIGPGGRPRRSAAVHHGMNGWASKKKKPTKDEYVTEEDEDSEPDFGDDEEEEHIPDEISDEDEEEFEVDELDDDNDLSDRPRTLIVKFPITVLFERATGKYIKAPSSWVPRKAAFPAFPSASSDSGSRGSMSNSPQSKDESTPEPPIRTAEEISVAVKPRTPDTSTTSTLPEMKVGQPLTPSSGMALAFRGSPEKPQHLPRPVDVGAMVE